MREIKFRAWDKNNREWVDPALLSIIGNGGLLLYRAQQWKVTYEDIDLMQFTGLHDKHGKEIYEGDIVRVPETKWATEHNAKIVWNGTEARYQAWTTGEMSFFHVDLHSAEKLEVIGNIFENPELLDNTSTK